MTKYSPLNVNISGNSSFEPGPYILQRDCQLSYASRTKKRIKYKRS